MLEEVVKSYNHDWIQDLYYKEFIMNKGYKGPYYVIGKDVNEVFTYKKDIAKRFGLSGTYKQLQEKLSKQGFILTREKE